MATVAIEMAGVVAIDTAPAERKVVAAVAFASFTVRVA